MLRMIAMLRLMPMLVLILGAGLLAASVHAGETYRAEEVTFRGASDAVQLAGTLTRPDDAQRGRKLPAILLIAGSGPADRDESIANHRPFRTIAEYLTAAGYAVLRYDKRGAGESTGPTDGLTLHDYAADAEAAFEFLRRQPDIDLQRTGILGHSEGGMIAPLIAAHRDDVAWLVLLGAPTVPGREIVLYQNAQGLRDRGRGEDEAQEAVANARELFDILLRDAPPEAREAALVEALETLRARRNLPEKFVTEQRRLLLSNWFRTTLSYDPAPALAAVRQPVLALYGALDHQVAPALNVEPAKTALQRNERATVRVLPGLNHLFFAAKTGAVSEYATIPGGVEPLALDTMRDWLAKLGDRH